MLTRDALVDWSRPPMHGQPYLRPLVCAGDPQRLGVFIAGINPATRIFPSDISISDYVSLLLDYPAFQKFYEKLRRDRNESKQSRTRPWIERLSRYVRAKYGHSVAETNVLPLPAKDVKDLYKQPPQAIQRAREVFLQLLDAIRPALLIVHGEHALCELIESVPRAGIKHRMAPGATQKGSLSGKEPFAPYLTLDYPAQEATDRQAQVLVSRHFRMYHFESSAFDDLERRVDSILRSPDQPL